MSGSRSVRAFVLVLTGYATVRTLWVWTPILLTDTPPPVQTAQTRSKPAQYPGAGRGPGKMAASRPRPAPGYITANEHHSVPPQTQGSSPELESGFPPSRKYASVMNPLPQHPPSEPTRSVPLQPEASPAPIAPAASAARKSRWSGYAYLFHRPDTGTPATLAPAGQIGGSQAAARLAWRLDDAGHLAVSARLATPLRTTAQAEAAIGADLIPAPDLRLSVERRIALGSQGRDAFAAYAATGLYRAVAPRIELDGYAQAGLVGARRRDPFADGALRLHHRTTLDTTTDLRLGAGAWGAAQPGAARLDLGPRAAITTRAARLPVTLALEGRLRVAGRARPGNGLALTLATDF